MSRYATPLLEALAVVEAHLDHSLDAHKTVKATPSADNLAHALVDLIREFAYAEDVNLREWIDDHRARIVACADWQVPS